MVACIYEIYLLVFKTDISLVSYRFKHLKINFYISAQPCIILNVYSLWSSLANLIVSNPKRQEHLQSHESWINGLSLKKKYLTIYYQCILYLQCFLLKCVLTELLFEFLSWDAALCFPLINMDKLWLFVFFIYCFCVVHTVSTTRNEWIHWRRAKKSRVYRVRNGKPGN